MAAVICACAAPAAAITRTSARTPIEPKECRLEQVWLMMTPRVRPTASATAAAARRSVTRRRKADATGAHDRGSRGPNAIANWSDQCGFPDRDVRLDHFSLDIARRRG